MASEPTRGDNTPGLDTSAAALGHERPDVPAYRALAEDLRERVDGEVQFDEYAQVLYATDGSIYQARPAGVVTPRSVADVQATMRVAADHGVPVIPRGAGSSLGDRPSGQGVSCSTSRRTWTRFRRSGPTIVERWSSPESSRTSSTTD